MKRAHVHTLFYSTFFLILTLGYQNCAPVQGSEYGGDMGYLDPLENYKVGFLADEIYSSKTADIHGVCDYEQNGAVLKWWAEDLHGEVVHGGLVSCFSGEFTILLEDLEALSCREDYVLHVQLGARTHHQADLLMDCE